MKSTASQPFTAPINIFLLQVFISYIDRSFFTLHNFKVQAATRDSFAIQNESCSLGSSPKVHFSPTAARYHAHAYPRSPAP